MFGSGVPTGTATIRQDPRRTPWVPARAPTACFAGAAGAASLGTAGWAAGTRMSRAFASTTWASAPSSVRSGELKGAADQWGDAPSAPAMAPPWPRVVRAPPSSVFQIPSRLFLHRGRRSIMARGSIEAHASPDVPAAGAAVEGNRHPEQKVMLSQAMGRGGMIVMEQPSRRERATITKRLHLVAAVPRHEVVPNDHPVVRLRHPLKLTVREHRDRERG